MKSIVSYLVLFMVITIDSLSQEPLNNDIVVNEIMFNPAKEGFDYVEGYNRSSKALSLNSLLIANRNATGDIAAIKTISKDSVLLNPGQYFVITTNEKWLQQNYPAPTSAIVCQISSMPSFPDDEGTVVLLRKSDSSVVDEVSYTEKWHFIMIKDPEGVALERIDYNFPGQDKNNWTSAAASSGSGTPGRLNSQFRENFAGNEDVALLPKIFTPNGDGVDDFTQVSIHTGDSGKIANALVYDVWGRRVRYLVKNELLGINNKFTWDGYDDRSQKLATGIYIVCIQIFDTKGNSEKFRHCVVLSDMRK